MNIKKFKFKIKGSKEIFSINNALLSTGRKDKNGREIFRGDTIKLHNKSEYTKREYWYPIYEVKFTGFDFGLKYIGGGLDPGSLFHLQHYPEKFEVMDR